MNWFNIKNTNYEYYHHPFININNNGVIKIMGEVSNNSNIGYIELIDIRTSDEWQIISSLKQFYQFNDNDQKPRLHQIV